MPVLLLVALGIILELSMYLIPYVWRWRRIVASCVLFTSFITGVLITLWFNVFSLIIVLINVYRAINMLRLIKNRMHEEYLKRTARQTSIMMLVYMSITVMVWVAWSSKLAEMFDEDLIISIVQLVFAIVLLYTTARTLLKSKPRTQTTHYADPELPSVTVAIPARNETSDLAACLQSVVASDYPKLEILVLDDCSQDDTPQIIRDYAQDGVRFIPGTPPAENWLAKNQAYAKLANESTGQYILYCGVDVRFGPGTIKAMVSDALSRNKRMVCVLPKRINSTIGSAVLQPLRYWWEIALPRRIFNRPPVLSTCWLVEKMAIKEVGGFDAVSRMIVPEAYLARELTRSDSYSFLRSSELLDVRIVKQFKEQWETAIRMRYPQLHRRPENVFFLTLIELLFITGPFAMLASSIFMTFDLSHAIALISCLVLIIVHSLIVTATDPSNWWFAVLTFPFAGLMDMIITHESMYRYEFKVISWKGRNVCIPVMHAIPKLPSPGRN